MNPVQRAVEHAGSQTLLASKLKITQPTVSEWSRGERPVPIEKCVDIERVTDGAVMRWDLRPSDWHRIWPELIGIKGAPPIPEQIRAQAA
jgi:DNA-binding transcriptional regulator YdaS (Cro superfamily)